MLKSKTLGDICQAIIFRDRRDGGEVTFLGNELKRKAKRSAPKDGNIDKTILMIDMLCVKQKIGTSRMMKSKAGLTYLHSRH